MAKNVTFDESELMNDAKYRGFVQQIDKALKAFEYTTEWADLVSALGKLNKVSTVAKLDCNCVPVKVLQNNTKYQVIPRRFLVGQRLAQCMHPALPSGVHLKALETYDLIFNCIGTERLVQELSIYSNGLFPLLSHAAINVKPTLLSVYENHFVPLGEHLRPALDGFLIAVLPGLEEGSDYHETTNSLLKKVCEGVGKEYFYGCLWKCILNNPSVRLPAVSFITLHFAKKKSLEDQLYVMGTSIETVVNGVCAALLDPNVLVQRAILDLLLCCFPMHNCQILSSDMISITTAAVTVLLRRDISLNRRLYSWIFGLEYSGQSLSSSTALRDKKSSSNVQHGTRRRRRENYFDTYSKDFVLKAFTLCLSNPSEMIPIPNAWSSLGDLWQYRLLICLLDNEEVSSPLLDSLSLEIFRGKDLKTEMKRTCNLLLSNLGIDYLWKRLCHLLSAACQENMGQTNSKTENVCSNDVRAVGSGKASIAEICAIMNFMADITSGDNYPDTATKHLPLTLNHVLQNVDKHCDKLSVHELNVAIKLMLKLIGKIQLVIEQDSRETASGKDKTNLSDIVEESESCSIASSESSLKVSTTNKQITKSESADSHVEKLISLVQTLFSTFVCRRLITNPSCIEHCYSLLTANSEMDINNFVKPTLFVSQETIPMFIDLCQLLIKASLLHKNEERVTEDNEVVCIDRSPCQQAIPVWLQQIMVTSCFLEESMIEVSYCAISTFLDLVLILKSQVYDFPLPPSLGAVTPSSSPVLDFNANTPKSEQRLCIDSMMNIADLSYIYNQTHYFMKVTQLLWNNLSDEFSSIHLETATLLQQLHNLAEDASVCESIICSSMASSDESISYEARKRFCTLYNITRDLKQKFPPNMNVREFDRPLFFILDSLTHKLDPHNAQAIDWLNQCLKNGDIARILEPLLFILLHPDTNRVSVQHVNIHQPENSNESAKNDEIDSASIAASESKIYAISSTGGNVMYHVNPEGKRRFASPVPPNKILALTSQSNEANPKCQSGKWVTSKFNLPDYEAPFSHEANNGKYLSINMFFNPFGSLSSLTSDALESLDNSSVTFAPSHPDLSNVKRLDTRRLIKSADDENESQSDSKVIASLLEDLVDAVVDKLDEDEDESSSSSCETTRQTVSESISVSSWLKPVSVNQLHSYILLYTQVYDSRRTLYALTTLWNIILSDPQKVLFNMATTSISNRLGVRSQELQQLCARHRKSLFGRSFYGELDTESATAFRSSSFLEVIVTTCLYYIRSYYPSLPQSKLNDEEIRGNQKVRILSCEILRLIFSELVTSIKGRPTFLTYMHDMLMRCKVQKIVLHSVVSSVYNFQPKTETDANKNAEDLFSDTIVEFNEKTACDGFQEDMQKSLLKLLEQLMILEHKSSPLTGLVDKDIPTHNRKDSDSRAARIRFQPQMSSLKYCPNIMIPSQSMFLSAIQTALQQSHKANLHANWLSLVESTLSFAGRSLTRLVVCVISQLCYNLENVTAKIKNIKKETSSEVIPPNYLIVLLKSLATLCHYCLLDTSNTVTTPPLSPQPQPPASTNNSQITSGPLQVLSNFLHVFSSVDGLSEGISNKEPSQTKGGDPLLSTRRTVLSHLPRILAAILNVWKAVSIVEKEKTYSGWEVMGSIKDVKQNILSFLSPISLLHGTNFMGAVAVVWYDLRDSKANADNKKSVIPQCSPDQSLLVDLIAAIRVLPMESVLQTVRQVMKQPPQTTHARKKRIPLEVNMLQFFLAYIRVFPGTQLLEGWKSLLALLKDGLQVSASQPLAQFHLLAILHEFVQAAPLIEDRKDQKDLQDVSQKLVDACTNVAGARLAQTRWLRRNFEVKPGPQHDELEDETDTELKETSLLKIDTTTKETFDDNVSDIFLAKYSVQALVALAEFVAPVLDVVYVSEEKEKVVPLVSNIMNYVTPYLRNHSKQNSPSFRACSQLLSSISGYQYTRKAWRKDAFELLLDPTFFQFDHSCLPYWKTVIDHLMTHDKTSFRDFLSRMSVNQSGSALKIFSSKDQENEQRSQLAKRLAFVIFCSEKDQYQRYMPEIQEKLIECMRVSNYPIVQSNVLLCFRVLLLRMSAHHLTSLWPFIYTELCQVFMQIEMELLTDTPEFSSHIQRLAALESSWVTSQSNGLAAHNHPGYLQMYLQACKLLDLAMTIPNDALPQFQMYRWAFVGDSKLAQSPAQSSSSTLDNSNGNEIIKSTKAHFEPHVLRIEKYLRAKNPNPDLLPYKPKSLLLTSTNIKSLLDLHPFFYTLVKSSQQTEVSESKNNSETQSVLNASVSNDPLVSKAVIKTAEELNFDDVLDMDFLEPLSN
ncbi:protein dopey-1-like isoform X7 [Dinothrombium tinctorium]|uniref:Protein dopey-1-like isoform X7 n=1 Tax=Dinothrombium tinctorium TaxID=1965070 RepID=A0A3S3PMG7_9ACAR|nr:protein dopey-1-like isoform X7 [Dinothrombium tinctorium]RWS15606.1 protein dopey-1-like isoform X7 [Dinothrombium tinctorium]RWS15610.1 protein dopey-1-like isoform X7 [Dinothrombium tinctorium]